MGSRFLRSLELKNVHVDEIVNAQTLSRQAYFSLTPIPCAHTSLPPDGMAKNYYYYYFFIYMDKQDHAIYRVWIHFDLTSFYPRREEQHLV